MYFQASAPSPKYLSIRDSLFINFELGRGLETTLNSQADSIRDSGAYKELTQYFEPRPTIALKIIH